MRFFILLFFTVSFLNASENQVAVSSSRSVLSLNGAWNIIIDPYENGYYSYRYTPRQDGFFQDKKQSHKSELIEYNFDTSPTLQVPGDWNSQRDELFLYEGCVWYRKKIELQAIKSKRYFIRFGAVNYHARVYLNGRELGTHTGGFTPFQFEITDHLTDDGENSLVVQVDNKREARGVPTLNTDWWNYGGITRPVDILETPQTFIRDYFVQLAPRNPDSIEGRVELDGVAGNQKLSLNIPDAAISVQGVTDENGVWQFSVHASGLRLWSPQRPYVYDVRISTDSDTVHDAIGFRTISVSGDRILLNEEPVFLRGISIHEEAPLRGGRAWTQSDAAILMQWAQDMGCNFVRLAHYPHNEAMIHEAERRGLMVWAEIPVYWTIQWDNPQTYALARQQLREMIERDKNRAAVIIWSVANETPRTEQRLDFLGRLIAEARRLDPSRLISAATELTYKGREIHLDDPLCEMLDVIGANEYLGWYGGSPNDIPLHSWHSAFNKPLIISEFGAGALKGFRADAETRWSEEYQARVYEKQLEMLKAVPFLQGMSPWILMGFRSPRRQLPGIQDFWNRKGLLNELGQRKQAFDVLRSFYLQKANQN